MGGTANNHRPSHFRLLVVVILNAVWLDEDEVSDVRGLSVLSRFLVFVFRDLQLRPDFAVLEAVEELVLVSFIASLSILAGGSPGWRKAAMVCFI